MAGAKVKKDIDGGKKGEKFPPPFLVKHTPQKESKNGEESSHV